MVSILTCGGIGDQILAFQAASIVKSSKQTAKIFSASRDEVFKPLYSLFQDSFDIVQIEESLGDSVVNGSCDISTVTNNNDNCIIWPDLIFSHPLIFDCKRFKTHPTLVRSSRLLTSKWNPTKLIYFGLNTTTKDYVYPNAVKLIKNIALRLPDYKCFFNNLTTWAGKNIKLNNLESLPPNVVIGDNLSFDESLSHLFKSSYCVTLDNGISHIAYQLGIPRLLLDARLNPEGIKWLARWREVRRACEHAADQRGHVGLDRQQQEKARGEDRASSNRGLPRPCRS